MRKEYTIELNFYKWNLDKNKRRFEIFGSEKSRSTINSFDNLKSVLEYFNRFYRYSEINSTEIETYELMAYEIEDNENHVTINLVCRSELDFTLTYQNITVTSHKYISDVLYAYDYLIHNEELEEQPKIYANTHIIL